jgi:hypothetical protein
VPGQSKRHLGRFPVRQGLQPEAQRHAGPLCRRFVPVAVAACYPDVYAGAGGVFQAGPTPWPLWLVHAPIMYSQIMLDKPLPS